MTKKNKSTQSFESIAERLETIAGRLEGGELPLEDALTLFAEGVNLAKEGTQRLDEAERRIEVLLSNDKIESLEGKTPKQTEQANEEAKASAAKELSF